MCKFWNIAMYIQTYSVDAVLKMDFESPMISLSQNIFQFCCTMCLDMSNTNLKLVNQRKNPYLKCNVTFRDLYRTRAMLIALRQCLGSHIDEVWTGLQELGATWDETPGKFLPWQLGVPWDYAWNSHPFSGNLHLIWRSALVTHTGVGFLNVALPMLWFKFHLIKQYSTDSPVFTHFFTLKI